MQVVTRVEISRFAEKRLRSAPGYIKDALYAWVTAVQREGIREVRRLPGYHDEPLHGDRRGQRSVRLSRSWRAVYIESEEGISILVIEVNKHAY